LARAAGRLAGRYLPKARAVAGAAVKAQSARIQSARIQSAKTKQSGRFVKHVVPAAVKPLHALWHQSLGFLFLVIAGLGAWKVWRSQNVAPVMLVITIIFVVIMALYGISSIRKANRISRS
jgi:sulfite exporter TauE/SafE